MSVNMKNLKPDKTIENQNLFCLVSWATKKMMIRLLFRNRLSNIEGISIRLASTEPMTQRQASYTILLFTNFIINWINLILARICLLLHNGGCKQIIIDWPRLEGNSISCQGYTFLFRSCQQQFCLHLVLLKGFRGWHGAPQGPSTDLGYCLWN